MNSTTATNDSADARIVLPPPQGVRERLRRFADTQRILDLSRRSGVKASTLRTAMRGGTIDFVALHRFWPVMDAMDRAAQQLDAVAPAARPPAPEPPAPGRNSPSLS